MFVWRKLAEALEHAALLLFASLQLLFKARIPWGEKSLQHEEEKFCLENWQNVRKLGRKKGLWKPLRMMKLNKNIFNLRRKTFTSPTHVLIMAWHEEQEGQKCPGGGLSANGVMSSWPSLDSSFLRPNWPTHITSSGQFKMTWYGKHHQAKYTYSGIGKGRNLSYHPL